MSRPSAVAMRPQPRAVSIDAIVPCGIRGKAVTSLAKETGRDLAPEDVARIAADRVAAALSYRPAWDDVLADRERPALSSPSFSGGQR